MFKSVFPTGFTRLLTLTFFVSLSLFLSACASKIVMSDTPISTQKNSQILIEEFMIPSDEV